MSASAAQLSSDLLATIQAEHPRLVRFCRHLTGDPNAAEDLAQETLLIAWQKRHTITDIDGLAYWLTAIARNCCRAWGRRHRRDLSRCVDVEPLDASPGDLDDQVAHDGDVTVELEREELATLLDQAMALLPAETRTLLVQHYLDAQPQGELAARFDLAPGTVAVRLHRGRLALRRALLDNFPEQAAAYGFVPTPQDRWQRTHLWCFRCGKHRLLGQHDREQGVLRFRCPEPCTFVGTDLTHSQLPFLRQVKAYKPAFKRVLQDIHAYYLQNAEPGTVPCRRCGRRLPLQVGTPPHLPLHTDAIYAWCEHCRLGPGAESWFSLAQSVPAVLAFWQAHPRMRALPVRLLEQAGCPALATGFESVTDAARIEVFFARHTFQVIHVET